MGNVIPQVNETTVAAVLKSKTEAGIFDVFLCHNSRDKPEIKEIAEELKLQGCCHGSTNGNYAQVCPGGVSLSSRLQMCSPLRCLWVPKASTHGNTRNSTHFSVSLWNVRAR
jgi:hypothetical protein